jgi:hypothetical protein
VENVNKSGKYAAIEREAHLESCLGCALDTAINLIVNLVITLRHELGLSCGAYQHEFTAVKSAVEQAVGFVDGDLVDGPGEGPEATSESTGQ